MPHRNVVLCVPFAFGVAGLFIVISICVAFRGYGYDDPYITFRYAQNLLQGKGLVYNVGEPVLSTTAPGFALLLGLLGLVYGDLPVLGNVLSAVGLGLGALALYLWASRASQPFVGWAAGLLLLTFPLCTWSFGSEMCLYIGTTICGFGLYARRRPEQAMAWMAFATLIRPDGILAAGLIALHMLFTRRRVPWKAMVLYLSILLPWIVYATWAFGSPIPVTLSAKRAQGQMAISDSFVQGAWEMLASYAKRPLYWLYLPLGIVGVWQIARREWTWGMLLVWTACSFVAYALLRVSRYFWYYVPLVPGVVLSATVGLNWVRAKVARWQPGKRWQWTLTLALLTGMLWPNVQGLRYIYTHPDHRLAIYRQIGQWIDAHLPPEASVGLLEVGIIGYYARRRVVDFAGLIQPEVHAQVSQATTYQDTASWAVQRYRPEYLAIDANWFPDWQGSVLTSCHPLRTFAQQGHQGELTVYECDWAE